MRTSYVFGAVACLAAALLAPNNTPSIAVLAAQGATPAAAPAIVLTNAWLIDGTGAPVVENAWIRIEGDRIAAVGTGSPPPARGAQVIDVAGRTVFPGLSDMHVHLGDVGQARWMLKLLLAHGVTRVKDAGNSLGNLAAIRRWLDGEQAVPYVGMSGVTINGSFEDLQFLDAGRRMHALLDDNLAFGVEFLKAYNWDSSQGLRQMAEFARQHDLTLTGHVPLGMTSIAAIDIGMQILEHVRLQPAEVHDDPDVIARYPIDISVTRRTGHWAYFDPDAAAFRRTTEALVKRKDKFFIDPTLVVQWAIGNTDGPAPAELGSLVEMISPSLLKKWRAGSARGGETGAQKLTAAEYVEAKKSAEGWVTFAGRIHMAGVRVLTGTDTPVEWVIPGHSLHQELEFFVKGGISPIEAIRSSTGRAGEAFRTPDRGTIAAGQVADLVIAAGNVAADISNVRRVEKVVLGGRVYDRSALLYEASAYKQETGK